MSRLLALANVASRRSQEVIAQIKYKFINILEDTASRQRQLSLNLGQKLSKLTLATADSVGLISQGGRNKLRRARRTYCRVGVRKKPVAAGEEKIEDAKNGKSSISL